MDGNGYYPIPCTTGLWAYRILETNFCLCVDDFGVKYFSKEESYHLLCVLKKNVQRLLIGRGGRGGSWFNN